MAKAAVHALGALLALVAHLAFAHVARAQATSAAVEGNVVSIETENIYVDLGSSRGALDGDVVELWRPIKIRHPVSQQMLTDRFLIGRLRLVQVRPTLSIATREGTLARTPAVGDVVIMARKIPVSPPVAGSSASPSASAPRPAPTSVADPEAQELNDLMLSLKGADLTVRIRSYEKYVYAKPQGRYAAVLWEEAQTLRKLLDKRTAPNAIADPPLPVPGPPAVLVPHVVSFVAPAKAIAGVALRFAAELDENAVGAVLHVRRAGDATFESMPMRVVGPSYYAADVRAEVVRSPGIEFFVEAVGTTGGTFALIGSAEDPTKTEVEDITPPPTARRPLMIGSIWTDYASFDARNTNDYVWQTEGVMGARLADEGLRAVRSGFGVYRGRGGTLQELDTLHLDARSVGLTYGYLEAEYGFTSIFSIAVRGILGLREDGLNGGTQGFFRIGNDRRTNLLFGGEVLGGIGLRGITQLEWNTIPRVPILLRTEVTNQPAGTGASSKLAPTTQSTGPGDIGVRVVVQVGYRVWSGLVLAGRVSYQGRTISHAGPGAGAAVTYEW